MASRGHPSAGWGAGINGHPSAGWELRGYRHGGHARREDGE